MNKSRFIKISICVMLVVILSMSLCACIKIGMKENVLISRLEDAGAVIEYVRTTPMTQGVTSYKVDDYVRATKVVSQDVDGVQTDVETQLYIIFAGNESAADWAEESCRAYLENNQEDVVGWSFYRHERVIMLGDYRLLAVARGY